MAWWRRGVLLIALAPLLAGCFALDADIDVRRDEQVGYSFHFEVDPASVVEQGLPADTDLCARFLVGENWFPQASTVAPSEREGYIGCQVSGTARIGDFGGSRLGDTGLQVGHGVGEFTFGWAPGLPDGFETRVDAFEVSVSFPGEVLEHSGSSTVAGTTVTWRQAADMVGENGLFARGRDTPSVWDSLRRWALYGVGALVLIGIGIVVLRRRAAPEPPPHDSGPAAGESIPWFDELAEAAPPGQEPAGRSPATWEGLEPPVAGQASGEGPATDTAGLWGPPVPSARWEVPPPEVWAPRPEDLPGADRSVDPAGAAAPQGEPGAEPGNEAWQAPPSQEPPPPSRWAPPDPVG